MSKTKSVHRVVVYLDTRMTLEAIILGRLERMPTGRRQEWLRGMLVQGLAAECQLLRSVPEKRVDDSAAAFTQWLSGKSPRSVTTKVVQPSPQPRLPQSRAVGKPFALLGKVIG